MYVDIPPQPSPCGPNESCPLSQDSPTLEGGALNLRVQFEAPLRAESEQSIADTEAMLLNFGFNNVKVVLKGRDRNSIAPVLESSTTASAQVLLMAVENLSASTNKNPNQLIEQIAPLRTKSLTVRTGDQEYGSYSTGGADVKIVLAEKAEYYSYLNELATLFYKEYPHLSEQYKFSGSFRAITEFISNIHTLATLKEIIDGGIVDQYISPDIASQLYDEAIENIVGNIQSYVPPLSSKVTIGGKSINQNPYLYKEILNLLDVREGEFGEYDVNDMLMQNESLAGMLTLYFLHSLPSNTSGHEMLASAISPMVGTNSSAIDSAIENLVKNGLALTYNNNLEPYVCGVPFSSLLLQKFRDSLDVDALVFRPIDFSYVQDNPDNSKNCRLDRYTDEEVPKTDFKVIITLPTGTQIDASSGVVFYEGYFWLYADSLNFSSDLKKLKYQFPEGTYIEVTYNTNNPVISEQSNGKASYSHSFYIGDRLNRIAKPPKQTKRSNISKYTKNSNTDKPLVISKNYTTKGPLW